MIPMKECKELQMCSNGLPLLEQVKIPGSFQYYSDPEVRVVAAYTPDEKAICAAHTSVDPIMTLGLTAARDERNVNGMRYTLSSKESFEGLVRKLEEAGFQDGQG